MNTLDTSNNTVAHFMNYLKENQVQELESIRVHKAIRSVLNKWGGKRINRRIVDQVKAAAYPGDESVVVYYDECAGMLNLRIWGGTSGHMYDQRESYFLGYTGDVFGTGEKYVYAGTYNAESFEDTDACHGHAAETRCKARQALLDNPSQLKTLVKSIAKVQAAYAEFSTLVNGEDEETAINSLCEIKYEAEKVLGLKIDHSNNR